MKGQVKVAAVQLATKIADSSANLANCERLAQRTVEEGAQWIALPEFFSTIDAELPQAPYGRGLNSWCISPQAKLE